LALAEWHLSPDGIDDMQDAIVEQLFESWIRRQAITGKLGIAWQAVLWGGAFGGSGSKDAKPEQRRDSGQITGRSGRKYQRVPVRTIMGNRPKRIN